MMRKQGTSMTIRSKAQDGHIQGQERLNLGLIVGGNGVGTETVGSVDNAVHLRGRNATVAVAGSFCRLVNGLEHVVLNAVPIGLGGIGPGHTSFVGQENMPGGPVRCHLGPPKGGWQTRQETG